MPETVQLLITCLLDTLYPEVGEAVVNVLQRAGVRVTFPVEQTCCGQPAFNAGMRHLARPIAEHTIRVFEEVRGSVVIPSGSCAAMIRHGYPELFADDPPWLDRAKSLAAHTYELCEFLVDILGVVELGARFPKKTAYHPSCHLTRDLGVDRQPHALLAAVRDIELVELPDSESCCGFGGVFSVEHPEISNAMLRRKIDNIEASAATAVVACDAGCMININGGLRRLKKPPIVAHIAEILASE
jgi:L-lactate dehydrogenase complex protein LldE